ncbi:hypothetical protein GCM10027428_27320 [Haliea atlantica]
MIAPAPVWMPHPSGPRRSKGASFLTFTTLSSYAKAKLAKEDWPKKWPDILFPPEDNAELPSARPPDIFRGAKLSQ